MLPINVLDLLYKAYLSVPAPIKVVVAEELVKAVQKNFMPEAANNNNGTPKE